MGEPAGNANAVHVGIEEEKAVRYFYESFVYLLDKGDKRPIENAS